VARDYRFPYAENSFDLVIATSVFTHLLPDAAERYLAEAARVLTPGGRLFTTWFLVGDSAPPPAPERFRFTEVAPPAHVADPAAPEAAVACPEGWLRERLRAHGLDLRAFHPGSWRGGAGTSWQDVVIADRS